MSKKLLFLLWLVYWLNVNIFFLVNVLLVHKNIFAVFGRLFAGPLRLRGLLHNILSAASLAIILFPGNMSLKIPKESFTCVIQHFRSTAIEVCGMLFHPFFGPPICGCTDCSQSAEIKFYAGQVWLWKVSDFTYTFVFPFRMTDSCDKYNKHSYSPCFDLVETNDVTRQHSI